MDFNNKDLMLKYMVVAIAVIITGVIILVLGFYFSRYDTLNINAKNEDDKVRLFVDMKANEINQKDKDEINSFIRKDGNKISDNEIEKIKNFVGN